MRIQRAAIVLVLGSALALAGCSKKSESSAAEVTAGGATVEATSGLTVKAAFDPATPKTGDNKLTLTVTGKDGKPVTGAGIAITPWMPDHNHGSDKTPLVTEKANGEYAVESVGYTMPGAWVLKVNVTHAGGLDRVELPVQVP